MQSNNLVFIKHSNRKTCDINNDYTLPDYIPDVKRLANTGTEAVIHNVFINQNSVTYEGEIIHSVMLICEDECIRNVIYSEEFSIENSVSDTGSLKCHEAVVENSVIRLISPRKLNCKAKITAFSKTVCEHSATPKYEDSLSIEDEMTIEKQYTECDCMSVDETSLNSLHASHDIELGQDKEEISSIVYCKVDTNIFEEKFNNGKLSLKGETSISILYESVNSSYIKTVTKLPFSEIVDDIKIHNGSLCKVIIKDIKVAVRNNSFGEMKNIELDYTYDVICRTYTAHKTELVNDIYSTLFETKADYAEAQLSRFGTVINSNLTVEGDFKCNENQNIDDTAIIDCFCSVNDNDITSDKNCITLNGTLKFDVVMRDEGLTHQTYTVPFKFERMCDSDICQLHSEEYVKVISCKAEIVKDNIYLSAELAIGIMIADRYDCRYVESLSTDHTIVTDSVPMVIYYPGKGETLWDVAKKFRCTCRDIMSANCMDSESLDGIKVLLLPRKKRKAVKSMII